MALLYGYAFSEQDEIRSVLSIAGPVGISAELLANPATAPLLREPIEWLVGAPIPTSGSDPNLQKYVQASPSTYVNQALPTLLIHGTDDELVPFGMVEAMKASLDGAGIHNTLVELAGARHNFTENPIHALMALNAVFDWISAQ